MPAPFAHPDHGADLPEGPGLLASGYFWVGGLLSGEFWMLALWAIEAL
jgi:hypothetical protein